MSKKRNSLSRTKRRAVPGKTEREEKRDDKEMKLEMTAEEFSISIFSLTDAHKECEKGYKIYLHKKNLYHIFCLSVMTYLVFHVEIHLTLTGTMY